MIGGSPTRNRARGRKVNRRLRSERRSGRHHPQGGALRQGLQRALHTGRRLALPVVVGAAAVTLAWVAGHYVITGPYFRLRTAQIHGMQRLAEADVLGAMELQREVSSTLGLDVAGLAAGLRKHPWVVDAEVERWLPDRLEVRVTERVPEAVVISEADPDETALPPPMLADAFGRRFAAAERPADLDVPAITGVELPDLGPGAGAGEIGERRLKTALAAMREWRRQGLDALDDLSEVHVDETAGLTLYTQRDGTAIRLGRRKMSARLARVRAVLSDVHARGERAEYVLADDSRDGARVVVRTAPRVQPSEADASEAVDASEAAENRRRDGTQG